MVRVRVTVRVRGRVRVVKVTSLHSYGTSRVTGRRRSVRVRG